MRSSLILFLLLPLPALNSQVTIVPKRCPTGWVFTRIDATGTLWCDPSPSSVPGPPGPVGPSGKPGANGQNGANGKDGVCNGYGIEGGSVNTAIILSIATSQSGKPTFCRPTGGSAMYACSLNASSALTTYTPGMILTLLPDIPCPANCSLNVDKIGQIGIKRNDGSNTDIPVPLGFHLVGYDGTVWRLLL